MIVTGVITLDGVEIGIFEIFTNGQVQVSFDKIDNNLADILEYAGENGMTVSFSLRPSYDDHVPRHQQDAPSPV